MKITPFNITVKQLVENYEDKGNDGVFAYNKLLTVRPAYQREFVYKDKQRDAVIDTVLKGYPLNTMYWVKAEDHFELLDGQQRTISICQFVKGDFSIKHEGNTKYFSTFSKTVQDQILNYKLNIYVCEGKDDEKLDWFRTINIAGVKLTDQELLNINYIGPWLTDAKLYFSKSGCKAAKLAEKYVKKNSINQELLEQALIWASDDGDPSSYMAKHHDDKNANDLYENFKTIIDWAKATFTNDSYKELTSVDWGEMYKLYHENTYNPTDLDVKVNKYMQDDDVTSKKGIFEYVLSGETKESVLNIRAFTPAQKRSAYAKQKGICPVCGKAFKFEDMEGDHIVAWSKGGKTDMDNLQMLCKECNRKKSSK